MDASPRLEFLALYGKHAARAMSLIRPANAVSEKCRDEIEDAIVELHFLNMPLRKPTSKEYKLAAGKLAAALRRVEAVLKSDNHYDFIQARFPHKVILEGRLLAEDAAADAKPTTFFRDGKFARTTKKRLGRAATAKRHCARFALRLMSYSSYPDTTKGRQFCKLAALLYGKPTADLTKHCKAARLGRTPKWGWK